MAELVPDRRRPDRLWVQEGHVSSFYGYDLVAGDARLLVPAETITLEGYTAGAFASLRDGSFLYAAGAGFRLFVAGGRPRDVAFSPGDVWAILPTERLDRIWVLRTSGELELSELLGRGIRRLRLVEVDGPAEANRIPYAAASEGRFMAVLWLLQPLGSPKRLRLDVFDIEGARKFSSEFSPELTEDENWVEELTRNASVALSGELVATGGPARLRVWNVKTGRSVFDEGPGK
jgi:hypothetical protein